MGEVVAEEGDATFTGENGAVKGRNCQQTSDGDSAEG